MRKDGSKLSLKSNKSREKPYTYHPAVPKKIVKDFMRDLFDDDVLNDSSGEDDRNPANKKQPVFPTSRHY